MSPDHLPARYRTAALMRLSILLLASGLLHWAALEWANGNIHLPSGSEEKASAMVAQLHPPVAALPAVASAPKVKSAKNAVRRKTRPKPRPQAAEPAVQAAAEPQAMAPLAVDDAAPPFAEEGALLQAPQEDSAMGDPSDIADPEQPPPAIANLPPPADLTYDVQALRDGNAVYGHGKISWRSDGNQYAVIGEAGILFFSVLNFRSSGTVDASGLAPVLYSEKRFRRPETNTHFQHERQRISFSATTASYPRQGGEQDRASIVWQLAGLGAAGEKFVPGAEIQVFVAGVRNGETWHIRVIGEEQIETGIGTLTAWHVTRKPRPGTYDQQIDIWLAPQQHWYPVKLRFTETNGEYLDMTLADLTLAAAPAAVLNSEATNSDATAASNQELHTGFQAASGAEPVAAAIEPPSGSGAVASY